VRFFSSIYRLLLTLGLLAFSTPAFAVYWVKYNTPGGTQYLRYEGNEGIQRIFVPCSGSEIPSNVVWSFIPGPFVYVNRIIVTGVSYRDGVSGYEGRWDGHVPNGPSPAQQEQRRREEAEARRIEAVRQSIASGSFAEDVRKWVDARSKEEDAPHRAADELDQYFREQRERAEAEQRREQDASAYREGLETAEEISRLKEVADRFCFPGETRVQVQDPSDPSSLTPHLMRIDQVAINDRVLTCQTDKGNVCEYRAVLGVLKRRANQLIQLHFGGRRIRTTENHPFYVQGKGWVEARELRVGDLFQDILGNPVPLLSKTLGEPRHRSV
jgi:hypothetical protein